MTYVNASLILAILEPKTLPSSFFLHESSYLLALLRPDELTREYLFVTPIRLFSCASDWMNRLSNAIGSPNNGACPAYVWVTQHSADVCCPTPRLPMP